MLTRDDLAALATPVYGSEWQSALARERGTAVRTVQRWAKDGIGKPETATAVRAYLLSRRVVDLPPPPPAGDPDERDDDAHAAMGVVLDAIVGAGRAIDWHDAELLAAMLGAIIDRMVEGAGAPATIETVRTALAQVQGRIAQ